MLKSATLVSLTVSIDSLTACLPTLLLVHSWKSSCSPLLMCSQFSHLSSLPGRQHVHRMSFFLYKQLLQRPMQLHLQQVPAPDMPELVCYSRLDIVSSKPVLNSTPIQFIFSQMWHNFNCTTSWEILIFSMIWLGVYNQISQSALRTFLAIMNLHAESSFMSCVTMNKNNKEVKIKNNKEVLC